MEPLTADAILSQVRRLRSTTSDDAAADGYRQAAAVLTAIAQPEQLRPVTGTFQPGQGVLLLGNELVRAPSGRLGGQVMLSHTARRAALRALATRDQMLRALEANPDERGGIVQQQFEAYLASTATPVSDQSREELEATLQVLLWLQDIVPGLPDIDDVRNVLALRDFMAPFETLSSDAVFRGRVSELAELRSFVGVLPPATLRERLVRAVIRPSSARALSVFGPGGVGKSALLARFILEHSRLADELRVPLGYLDFDRSTLSVTQPRVLAEELVRQLILQYPDSADFQNLRGLVQQHHDSPVANGLDSAPAQGRPFNLEQALNDVMRAVQKELPNRPYLLVLDTFEQVQYLGETHALSLWQILGKVQERHPILRIVVCGRAPVASLRLGGELPKTLAVGALDTSAAVAFVKTLGNFADDVAAAIVQSVGGVPLSLKLAARLLRDTPAADLGSRGWLRAADEVIQGQLFDRILGQIHDDEVRRVAHPGLVLRRITPEVLLEVLREPCELTIATLPEAVGLFSRLQSEVSLVSFSDDGDGALVHRREVREVMLKLLRQRSPAIVRDISERAVTYYSAHTGTRARMEQTYHELALARPVQKPTFDDREIRASIQASIAELPIESQQLLASYGFQVDAAVLAKASTDQQEAAVAEFVDQMLPHGAEGFAQARARLEEIGEIDHDSPLWRAHARLRFEADDREGAADALNTGLRLASSAGSSFRVLELLSDQAWQQESGQQHAILPDTLTHLGDFATRNNDAAAALQHFLQRGRIERRWFAARSDVLTAERLFKAARPRDFFGLLPATRGFWAVACDNGFRAQAVTELVLDPESGFDSVTFPNHPETHRAVQELLRCGYDRRSEDGPWLQLAEALEAVIAVWPYRNLHVHPPQADSRQFAR